MGRGGGSWQTGGGGAAEGLEEADGAGAEDAADVLEGRRPRLRAHRHRLRKPGGGTLEGGGLWCAQERRRDASRVGSELRVARLRDCSKAR